MCIIQTSKLFEAIKICVSTGTKPYLYFRELRSKGSDPVTNSSKLELPEPSWSPSNFSAMLWGYRVHLWNMSCMVRGQKMIHFERKLGEQWGRTREKLSLCYGFKWIEPVSWELFWPSPEGLSSVELFWNSSWVWNQSTTQFKLAWCIILMHYLNLN